MSLLIRAASHDDLEAIVEIYRHSVEHGTATYELTVPDFAEMERRFNALNSQNYPYLVAEEDGVVIGYAYAGPFRTRPAYRWSVEDSIYLSPQAQGKGIGYKLLITLIEVAQALGFRQMVAIVGGASEASIAVHAKAGFEHSGVMKATGYKHGKWLDTTIMQLPLGEGQETDPDLQAYPGNLYSS
jgi:L-amino acid N-acyltransferase YncA